MNRKKTALLILSVLMCCCLVGGIFAATAAAPKTYYDEAGNVLDWAFDQNGVSPVIPYADQNKTPVSQYYGIYSPDKAYSVREDGSIFVLAAAKYTLLGGELDVTKNINISFTMDPNNAWSAEDGVPDVKLGRFFFALFGDLDTALAAGNNAWQTSSGSKFVAFGNLNPNQSNLHRISVNGGGVSDEFNYNGNNAVLTIRIGETKEESKVFFNGVEFSSFNAQQSDFAEGKAFMSFVALDKTLEAKMKITQSASVEPSEPGVYYDQEGNVLDWAFDQNGVSQEIPYDQNGNAFRDNYGMYAPENCYAVKEEGSIFVLVNGNYIVLGEELDITQAIDIDFQMDPQAAWSANGLGRFFFALFDSLDAAMIAGSDAWKAESGSKAVMFGGMNEMLAGEPCPYYHRISVAGGEISDECNYDGGWAKLTIYIGETEEESFVAFNNVAFSGLSLKQSDFADGTARLSMVALEAHLEAQIKISQRDIRTEVHLKSSVDGFEETTVKATVGRPMAEPAAPTLSGYTFEGWYQDEACILRYDFAYPVTGEMTLYANYLDNSRTYHTVTLRSERGDYRELTFKVASGDAIGAIGTVFESEGFTQEWKTEDGPYDLSTPVNEDITLTAVWVEEPLILYHKMNGVVDESYRWEGLMEENGFDIEATIWDNGDTFVDENGNEIISMYYGSYQYDTSFKTYDQYTDFLLAAAGAITNLKRLDLTKEIVITYSVNNWDTANNNAPAAGDITFQLFDNVLSALKAGHAGNAGAKAAILTSTVDASVDYGKFKDVFNNVKTPNLGYEQDKQFVIKIFVSEDGASNYVTVNGTAIEGALAGLKRSDFKGGYAYLHIANSGSTHMFRCLVSQTSGLTLAETENGSYTSDKQGEVLFKDRVTLTIKPDAGYAVSKVVVGGREYLADANNIVTFYKGWDDETVEVYFDKAYTATFHSNGGSEVAPQTVCEGGLFYKPSNPRREGYKFVGWYTDEALTQEYDFKTAVTADISLYAKWEENRSAGCDCGGSIGFGSALLALAAIGLSCALTFRRKR